jgi:hypothetical protein
MTRSALSLLALLLLAGCDGDDPPQPPPPELPAAPPLPECPDATYTPCDVRARKCQAKLGELAACLRKNDPLDHLTIDVLSEAAYTAMERGELSEPKPSALAFRRALAAFELLPPDAPSPDEVAEDRTSNIAGLYRSDQKRIIIVDHGKPADSVNTNLTLLHEFIHALQDADVDLENWPAGAPWNTFDLALARKSVVEGEATFYEYRAAVPFLGLDIAEADVDSALLEHLDYVIKKDFESDVPLDMSFLTFPYAYGARLAYAGWLDGGPRGTDPLWATPPATTQQVMATVLGLGEPVTEGIEIAPPDLSQDSQPYDSLAIMASDSLGAWGLALLLNQVHQAAPDKLALAWRGDRLFAAQPPSSDTTCALWEFELDSAESAQAVDKAFGLLQQVRHDTIGSRVYLSGAYPPSSFCNLAPVGKRWLSSH